MSQPPENGAKKKRRSITKEYVPKPGSGGYAILLALYRKSKHPGFVGHMTKERVDRRGGAVVRHQHEISGKQSVLYRME